MESLRSIFRHTALISPQISADILANPYHAFEKPRL